MKLKKLLLSLALSGSLLIAQSEAKDYEIIPVSKTETEVREKNLSLDIYDFNSDRKADLVTIMNDGENFSFFRPIRAAINEVKEVQLFDIADKFLKSEDEKEYSDYLSLIKSRFPFKKIEIHEKTDLGKFFAEDFKPQDNIEDLIAYSYLRYSRVLKEIKKTKPNQTFQNLMDNCNLLDAVRFVFLFKGYNNNLVQFGYKLDRLPSFENDYFEINFVSLGKWPSLKAEMNMNFDSDTINTKEIGDFLNDKDRQSFFKYDDRGNYFYGIFKYKDN